MPLLFIVLIISMLVGGVVYAATWEYKYPIIITDTSNVTRSQLPVMLGFGGQNLVNAGKIATSGNDTNLQIGATSIKYMMSTTNVTAVLPILPSGGQSTTDMYTGYAPEQTGFPIIVGNNGYVSTTNDADLEWSANGSIALTDAWIDTTVGTFCSGNYPTIRSQTAATAGTAAIVPVAMPAGWAAGDMLMMLISVYDAAGAASPVITTPAGWTLLYHTAYGTWERFGAYYKVATGAEANPTNVTVDRNSYYCFQCIAITTGTYIGVPVAGVTATGAASNPNPPLCTSGYGVWTTRWFAVAASRVAMASAPAGYSNLVTGGANSSYTSTAEITTTAASEDPGTFGTVTTQWAANTIAIVGFRSTKQIFSHEDATNGGILCYVDTTTAGKINLATYGVGATSTSVSGITSGAYNLTASLAGGTLTFTVGATSNTTALAALPNSTANWSYMQGNSVSYATSISISVGGVQKLLYQPNTMLTGAILPDRINSGGYENGTITWGTNSGLTVTYGEMVSYASTEAGGTTVGGWVMPEAEMPSSWFAGGSLTGLPFYDAFLAVSVSTGQPLETIYFLAALGFAFGVFLLLVLFTRSALLAVVGFNIVLFVGSSMSIVPSWLPFSIIVVQFGIMYLYKQVAY